MTHHSGLPSDYLKGMWTRDPEPFTRVADRLKDEYATNPPGAVFSYSIPLLFPGTASFAVAPVSDDEAEIRGVGRGMGETIRAFSADGEEMLSYSGYLLRKKRS